jgi:hypothetical protein
MHGIKVLINFPKSSDAKAEPQHPLAYQVA